MLSNLQDTLGGKERNSEAVPQGEGRTVELELGQSQIRKKWDK